MILLILLLLKQRVPKSPRFKWKIGHDYINDHQPYQMNVFNKSKVLQEKPKRKFEFEFLIFIYTQEM